MKKFFDLTKSDKKSDKSKKKKIPDEEVNQIKISTEENNVLKTENADQKEQIKKLQIDSDSKDKIIADLFFTVIDEQLKGKKKVKLDYVTEILENIKKQEVNSASIDKIVGDFVFTVIDKQLKRMKVVKLDCVTKILENMAVTEREISLNRKDNNGNTFLHRLVRLSHNTNGFMAFISVYLNRRCRENYHKLIELLLTRIRLFTRHTAGAGHHG